MCRAVAELVAGSVPDRLDPVGDAGEGGLGLTAGQPLVSTSAQIAVAAGLRERLAAEHQPWPHGQTLVKGAGHPQSAPPTSRTVVNPRRSIRPASASARTVAYPAVQEAASTRSNVVSRRWTWASTKPGMTVAPAASMTLVSAAGAGGVPVPESAMTPPEISIQDRSLSVPAAGSSRCASRTNRVSVNGGSLLAVHCGLFQG